MLAYRTSPVMHLMNIFSWQIAFTHAQYAVTLIAWSRLNWACFELLFGLGLCTKHRILTIPTSLESISNNFNLAMTNIKLLGKLQSRWLGRLHRIWFLLHSEFTSNLTYSYTVPHSTSTRQARQRLRAQGLFPVESKPCWRNIKMQ